MILIPGTAIALAASELAQRPSDKSAWLHGVWLTVRLHDQIHALRVHVGAGEGGATAANIHLVTGSGPHGKRGLQGTWYAIGDFIQPYKEYIRTRALPKTVTRFGRRSLFTEAAVVTYEPGVVLNVGRAAPLNGHPGGGEQAEFLEGPAPRVQPLCGVWGREYGHA